ncbi:asparaginase-domain-containing protein [Thelephora ganbajun]|uniref:Asparaginase-domain-containing protein n=1 Tax=Thelephora ganbajun TaxID=370292 RepID=A0ACB6ZU38_THEGA|nr:asparaginase-domain-containing protein [Thelephora ganbajun]
MELSSDESRILVIYTGGTIGMLIGSDGYSPEPHFLTQFLRSQARFHDPLQDSLFSNAGSSSTYREWSNTNSGRSSPSASDTTSAKLAQHTLSVRSTRKVGRDDFLIPAPSSNQGSSRQTGSTKIFKDVYECCLPSLVTPRSSTGQGGKRIRYAILEWLPLMDSSNIEIDDWIRIATEIELNYATFDAFVILHGTDTMAYTASALSFVLEDLGKTVILTGAQIPLSQLRNDAADNFLGALVVAGQYIIPECALFFNHTLYRGNRVSKISSYELNAYDSPNFPPLVKVGIDIVVNWMNVIRQTSLHRFKAHKKMSSNVATLRLFPGITVATVRAFLNPPIKGVVLETFGAGNAPQRPELADALREACNRGVVIVAISQCTRGAVSDAYEAGRKLLQAGVIPGGDMTPECALTKLSYLLSKPSLSVAGVRDLMGTPLRGELTRVTTKAHATQSAQTTMDEQIERIQGILSQVVRLSSRSNSIEPAVPSITVNLAEDSPSPWTWTAAEATSTEASLLPFVTHLAVARDDPRGLEFCLRTDSVGDVANCLDVSGRSPLHTAAINNSIKCVCMLLEKGALVHLRDSLGHTPLYYAARMKHGSIVDSLVSAGANLGGSDVEGGFADVAIRKALRHGDEGTIQVWQKSGISLERNMS